MELKLLAIIKKPSNANPNGGIVKSEAPIHVSKVQLIDPTTDKTTRVAMKEVDGKKVRTSSKSGALLDK